MKWKFTIDSQRFKERHLIRRKQLRGPDVLILNLCYEDHEDLDYDRTFVFGSSIAWTFKFPITCSMFCYGSCDGLICVFCMFELRVVANPATGWHRILPLSNYQHLIIQGDENGFMECPIPRLGFGRDKLRGTYKPVWLYNSSGFVPKVVTHCEVFDFSTNTWRYMGLFIGSPRVKNPWYYLLFFTPRLSKSSVKLPLPTLVILTSSPCASLITACKTWKTMCSLDLNPISSWWSSYFALLPIANLDKGRILPQSGACIDPLVIHDPHTQSYELLFQPNGLTGSVYYFESLFSTLCN
ncbi:hypothetical protein Bca4012_092717 [Brassica carinata]|uniref:F-box associated beta-propeller type 1 domain-containing protein n=1 Tax=Brassica oleracea var. oleracea TaxID=109376 RepID=A0A0D3DKQ3_BRAOL